MRKFIILVTSLLLFSGIIAQSYSLPTGYPTTHRSKIKTYAKNIAITTTNVNGTETLSGVKVIEGKDMQTQPFKSAEIYFEADGVKLVRIIFRSTKEKAVWLNSFVLSEWF